MKRERGVDLSESIGIGLCVADLILPFLPARELCLLAMVDSKLQEHALSLYCEQKYSKEEKVYYERTGLVRIPKTVFRHFVHMTRIQIKRSQLQAIPDAIGDCVCLEVLYMNGNQIQYIPESIGRCRRLRLLDLSNNQIQIVPDTIGCCEQLESLYLSRNRLTTIPITIGCLTKLGTLCIQKNIIDVLPDTIGNCTLLHHLDLGKNPLKIFPYTLKNCRDICIYGLDSNVSRNFDLFDH